MSKMCLESLKGRLINSDLTKMIIKYHELGYTEDFFVSDAGCCLFSPRIPENSYHSFNVLVIDQFYDAMTGCYKYMHTIETGCGTKGLLLTNCLLINKIPTYLQGADIQIAKA